ncbi:MAG: type IV pilus assembly protein PilM [Lacisediminihabitans sp.]
MAHSIVGVDIGTSSIRAVEVQDAAKARPTITRFHEIAIPDGAARAGEVLEPHTVAAVLKRLWSTGGFRSRDIVLGMGNQRVLARDVTLPYASLTQIRESLPFQVQDLLPVPVADAVLDFYPVAEDTADSGRVVHGLLVAATRDAVMANITAARLAGLSVVDVDLIPFAITRVHRSAGLVRGTLAVVDIGASTTNVVVTKEGVPQFVRIIPVGGGEVTRALSERLEVSPEAAEQLKRQLGVAVGSVVPEQRAAVEVIYAVTGELIASIRNTLNYYVGAQPGRLVDGVVLTGGGARLSGFSAALGEVTRIPVSVGNPLGGAALTRAVSSGGGSDQAQSMTVALGLAIGGAR